MLAQQSEILQAYGMDIASTVARFGGNEALMMRFLKTFPNDPTMQSLRDAVAAGNREAIGVAAHSLKGLTGNLGLTSLFEESSLLMNALRQDADAETTQKLYESVCEKYDVAIEMLVRLAAAE